MSRESAPRPNVVDLRRWREERDRRLRAATAETEKAAAEPDRIDGLYRVLALVAGLGFIAFGALLVILFLTIHREEGLAAWVLAGVLLVGLGGALALIGFDLMVRGIVGREWTRPLWTWIRSGLDRKQGHKGQQRQQGRQRH